MLFSSMVFIWAFLPVVFIGNAILQMLGGNKAANVLLLQIPLNRRTDSADCGVSIPM